MIREIAVAALLVTIPSCKSKAPSEQKGVYANPKDGYFSGEEKALAVYEYSFQDPNLPKNYVTHPSTGASIEIKNAVCIYTIEFDPGLDLDEATEITLFKSARPITLRAIERKGLDEQTASYFEAYKNAFNFRSNAITVSNELTKDESQGYYKPEAQADLKKTSAGIRTIKRYLEIAGSNESSSGPDCPASHPKADRLQVPVTGK